MVADVKVRAHTFAFITPAMTDKYKIPNPCTTCHADNTTAWSAEAHGTGRSTPRGAWTEGVGIAGTNKPERLGSLNTYSSSDDSDRSVPTAVPAEPER